MTRTGSGAAASRDLQALLDSGAVGGLADGQLLERFLAKGDGVAFEALVLRHGPMVWGVCRRALGDHHDAQDAFQATFLVLARRAASVVPRELVGHWLHGVAVRTALKAKGMRARRRAKETTVTEMPEPVSAPRPTDDRLALLDQELGRLPRKYRVPIVVCDLEGATQEEAARRLGCPVGTLSGRLWRGRAMLAKRMTRRGLTLSSGSLAMLLAEEASAAVPQALVATLVNGAVGFAAGRAVAPAIVSADVVRLAEGVIKAMLFAHWKHAALVLTALGVLGSGMVLMASPPPLGKSNVEGEPKAIEKRAVARSARPAEQGGPILRGRVVDEAGRPLAGVWVVLYSGSDTRIPGQNMLTGADGRYRFDPLKTGNRLLTGEAGRWDLGVGVRVEHPTHASDDRRSWWELRVPDVDGREYVKDFTMVPGGSLEGRVVDADTGKPLPGVNLLVEGVLSQQGKFGRHAMTAEDGRFVLAGFFPGPYTIRVELTGLFPGEYADEADLSRPGLLVRGHVTIAAQQRTRVDFPIKAATEAWVAKVLEAHGGEKALGALSAFTETIRTTPGGGKATTVKHFIQLPDKYRSETRYSGEDDTMIDILTPQGMTYWSRSPDGKAVRVTRLSLVERPYEYWLDMLRFFGPRSLLRLKDTGHRVTALGESILNGRPVVGLRVQKSDARIHADVRMIFDKETGRLLRLRDDPHGSVTAFRDGQNLGAIPVARWWTSRHHNQPKETTENEVVEIEAVDKFDPALFEKP